MFTKDNLNIRKEKPNNRQKLKKIQKKYSAKKQNKNKNIEKTQAELKCVTTKNLYNPKLYTCFKITDNHARKKIVSAQCILILI